MKNIVLKKNSTEKEIRAYFEKILQLKQSSEQFPVNLDEVWMLVYAEKGTATRALKRNFIKNEDFITVGQNVNGGKFTEITYKLSISCLEYFIARKVRPVFEIYRKVFHRVAENEVSIEKPKTSAEMFLHNAQLMVEHEHRISSIETKMIEIEAKQTTRPEYYTIAGFGIIKGIKVGLSLAAALGRKASSICKSNGYSIDKVHDPRFGLVGSYPKDVLDTVFSEYHN